MKQLFNNSISLMLAMISLLCSCNKEPESVEYRTIHYIATARDIGTRATLNGEGQYVFEASDRLYISATGADEGKLYGFLVLVSGAGTISATFEGDLYCADGFDLKDSTPVSVTLVSLNDIHTTAGGKVTATTYPTDKYAASLADAIREFSDFTGTGTFGSPSFVLSQNSAFLIFNIRLKTAESPVGTIVSAQLYNNNSQSSFWAADDITTTEEGRVSFVVAFKGGQTTLSNAKLSISWEDGNSDLHSKDFADICTTSNQLLENNNYYNITRSAIEYDGFRIKAIQNSTGVTFNYCGNGIQYSRDAGDTWVDYDAVLTITLSADEEICFKSSVMTAYDNSDGSTPIFTANKKCYIAGDIMSLVGGANALQPRAFYRAFSRGSSNTVTWIDINPLDPLILPATTLNTSCYEEMFRKCTQLTTAPNLPAETLASKCYFNMFRDCSALTSLRCYINVNDGGGTENSNYDRIALKNNLDKWMVGINTTGKIYCHPSMANYWSHAHNQSGEWYEDYTFASIPANWSVDTWTPAP